MGRDFLEKLHGWARWLVVSKDKKVFESEVICVFRLARILLTGFPFGIIIKNCTSISIFISLKVV